ncbi:MAG: glycosyltransferase family 4 protein [Microcoleaceae cyanobacterium]
MTISKHQKVSIVVSDLSEKGVGRWAGGGVRPFLLSRVLQSLNYDVEIVGFVAENTPAIQTAEIPIKAISYSGYPQFINAARQLLSQIDGDIIYAYKLKPSSFAVSLINKWTQNKPLLLDIDDWELSWHGGEEYSYRPHPKQFLRDLFKPNGVLREPDHPRYIQWVENWVNHADIITTHNQFLQNKFGGICLPNGKDVSVFNPENYDSIQSKAKYNLSDYRVLMFPGAPRPYKGVEDILIALDHLNDSRYRLVIVGGSPYDDYDQQLMKQWGKWMIKLPKIPYTSMPEVVAAADVIMVPQRNSPAALAQFPLKLTDGMAMAKPIIASRVGDIPDILAETGYLVSPSSPEEIAAQITNIFDNLEQAKNKGGAARKRCIQYYSLEAMASILSEVISTLRK